MKQGKYTKRKKRAPLWYYALLLVLVGVFATSAWYLADYFIGSRQQAGEYDDLAAIVDAARPAVPDAATPNVDMPDSTAPNADMPDTTAPSGGNGSLLPPISLKNQVDENGILLEYAPLYAMNSDMVGWISIEGTKINYPVMQTPEQTDYYLQRNFKEQYSAWGCIYAREECDLEEPSDNITLYGHNMKDGSMFAGLHSYTSREFWEEHRYIRFDTLREHHTYEIFAVFKTTATNNEGFEYHEFIDAMDEIEFDAFVAKCLSLSLYGTDIVPEYGDKIICLSTCEYSQTNGRLVVAAVRID